jgi:hypothetical protein
VKYLVHTVLKVLNQAGQSAKRMCVPQSGKVILLCILSSMFGPAHADPAVPIESLFKISAEQNLILANLLLTSASLTLAIPAIRVLLTIISYVFRTLCTCLGQCICTCLRKMCCHPALIPCACWAMCFLQSLYVSTCSLPVTFCSFLRCLLFCLMSGLAFLHQYATFMCQCVVSTQDPLSMLCVYAFSLAFAGHVLSHVVSTQRLAK